MPNKIFVGGVPITVSDEQFRTLFENFGRISRVELHALRGFGYVTYESVEAVDACLEKYDEHYFNKKWVEVKRSIPRELIESYEREQKRLLAEQEAGDGGSVAASFSIGERTSPTPGLPPPGGAAWPGPTTGLPPPPAKAGGWAGRPAGPATHEAPSAGWGARAPTAPARQPGRQPGKPEPSGTVVVSKVAQLKEMGFSEAVAKQVLAECVWDVNAAIDRLLSSGVMPGEESPPPAAAAPSPVPAVPAVPPMPSNSEAFPGLSAGPSPAAAAPPPPPAHSAARGGYHPRSEDFHVEEPGESEGLPDVGPAGSPAPGYYGEQGGTGGGEDVVADIGQQHAEERAAEANAAAEAEPMEEPGADDDHAQAAPQQPQPQQSPKQQHSPQPQQQAAPQLPQSPKQQKPHLDVEATAAASAIAAAAEEQAAPSTPTGQPTGAAARATGTPTGAEPVPPRKRLERAAQSWAQQDSAQLGITEGQYVSVWLDTRTEHGWIHAEAYVDGNTGEATAGWLPVCVLQELPEGRRWMRALQRWAPMDASQSDVEEGGSVIVWVGSKTKEGWAYVEAEEGIVGGPTRPGWLPVFCLEWVEE